MSMQKNDRKIGVIGLGYVGLPVAVSFGKQAETVGFDINSRRITELKEGIDRTGEVTSEELRSAKLILSDKPEDLKKADFFIVTVPTPIDSAKRPDLTPVVKASETVGRALKKGDIVVYESTVYPGVTEDVCAPILEKHSGLKCGVDFWLGYSPERINPGDKEHRFETIKKVVSGQTPEVLEIVARAYGSVVKAGIHKAASIKVAEAAKVIENTQRDVNIALMNELSLIFHKLDIDTLDVLEAAGTKWNFLPFRPGLVGGHCIGVDPYYLTHRAEELGYHPEVILSGRRINDSMGANIAAQTVKELVRAGHPVKNAKVTVLGLTFKENCPDMRNSRVEDIVKELKSYDVDLQLHDAMADLEELRQEYGKSVVASVSDLKPAHAVILAVSHKTYLEMGVDAIRKHLVPGGVVIDVKSVLSRSQLQEAGLPFWRL